MSSHMLHIAMQQVFMMCLCICQYAVRSGTSTVPVTGPALQHLQSHMQMLLVISQRTYPYEVTEPTVVAPTVVPVTEQFTELGH